MKCQIIVTEPAAKAIEDDAAWWARERSIKQAARRYEGIRAAIDSLRSLPARCAFAAENGQFPYELRELHFGLGSRQTHRIVFTIVKQNVIVLAVRHSSQKELRPRDVDNP